MRPARPQGRRGRGGFSLLELVAVLSIVGLLAVFVLPRLTNAPGVTISAVASQVAGSVRYAQSLAMSRGQRYRVAFTATSYQVTDGTGAPIVQPMASGTGPVSVAPATLSGFNPPLTAGYIAFDTLGTPYVSPTLPLAAAATILITSGTDTASVTVAPETGRVR
ncbi:MAG TPA: GspH/FimT family pseudopilin [Usitatibacter sp.]|nr:GspH/FimT family pseudopilin [Usitatibacter sp.]